MEIWLLNAERLVATDEETSNARTILGHIAALRSVHRVNHGHLDEAQEIASSAISYLAENDSNVKGMLQTALGIVWMLRGKFDIAIDYYLKSKTNLHLAKNTCAEGRALHLAGRIELDRGNLHHAYKLSKEGDSFSGVGQVYFEWNQLDKAFEYAERYYEIINKFGVAVEILNAVPLAHMHLELGELRKS